MISSTSSSSSTISKSTSMRFLFLQLLLLSSHCLSAESTLSSDDSSTSSRTVNVFTTRDTAPRRDDLPPISLNLRASKLAEDTTSSLHPQKTNATNSTNADVTISSFSSQQEDERQLRKKTKPETSTSTNKDPITIPTNSSDSKKDNIMFRIIGGYQHEASGMPNFAMLLARSRNGGNEYFSAGCGGSLISPCHVLTAAHCVDDPSQISGMGIYINAYTPWSHNNNGLASHFTTLAAYAIHPSYTNYANSRPVHDVAVLTLAKCVDENNNDDKNLFLHNIMELATMDDWNRLHTSHSQTTFKVSGFGSTAITAYGGMSNEFSKTLRTVSVPFQPQCSRQGFYSWGLVQEDNMMCAGSTGRDACFGDSGGPLYYEYSSRTATRHPRRKQYGIVSWGHGCGLANKPGVYASVAHHYDYIKGIVCSNPNVQMSEWGGSSATTSNMCGRSAPGPPPPTTRRPSNRPTRAPTTPRPTRAPTTRKPTPVPTPHPTPHPTRKPTRSPTSEPTRPPSSVYTFENGSTAERKERSSNNDKVADKLSGGTYVSSISRIRGGGANKLAPSGGNKQQEPKEEPNERRRRRQLLGKTRIIIMEGPEEI